MESKAFRKIIEDATGKTLEEVRDTPLAVQWAEAEKKLGRKIVAKRMLDPEILTSEQVDEMLAEALK